MTAVKIMHSKGRFYARTAHGEAELLYRKVGEGKISIFHTYVPEEERGRRIAEALARKAFDFANRSGLAVIPDCDYIKHFVLKHTELVKHTA
jgi:predicted GNAT family acetyltransferase